MTKAQAKTARKLREHFIDSTPAVLLFQDPEEVHRMRVAGRTLLAYMDFTADKKERKRPELRGAKKAMKGYMRLLGGLRDLDVLIDEIRQRMATCDPPQLALLARWVKDSEKERETVRKRADALLRGISKNKFGRILDGWEDRLGSAGKTAPEKRLAKLRGDAADALTGIAGLESYPVEDEAFLDRMHMARIRVKKLRYALTTAGSGDAAEIERLKAIQDGLGRAQDLRVWRARLEKYRKRYPDQADDLAARLENEMAEAFKAAVSGMK